MRSASRPPALTAAFFLVVAGCVSSVQPRSASEPERGIELAPSRAAAQASTAAQASAAADAPCVMEVPGTGIRMRPIDGGVAVTFDTVARGHVDELRAAVRRFGDALVHGHGGHHHSHLTRAAEIARRFRAQQGAIPALRVAVHDVGRGAVLELRARDTAEVELVRTKLRAEVGIMQRGVCPLLDGAR